MNRSLKLTAFKALFLSVLGVFITSIIPNNPHKFGENLAYAQEEEQKKEEQPEKEAEDTEKTEDEKVSRQRVKKKLQKKSNSPNKMPPSTRKHSA